MQRLAFTPPAGWALLAHLQLALMTAVRAQDMNIELSITIATPEDAPLAIFGREASDAVRQLLEDNGIATITSAHCEVPEPGRVAMNPGARHLSADRIVAMPDSTVPPCPVCPGSGRRFHPGRRSLQGARYRRRLGHGRPD